MSCAAPETDLHGLRKRLYRTPAGQLLDLLRTDMAKFVRYGRGFPRMREQVWVETEAVRRAIIHPTELGLEPGGARYARLDAAFWKARSARGRVVPGGWFGGDPAVSILDSVKIRCALEHWGKGVPWAATGIYDHLMRKIRVFRTPQSGCWTLEDVRRRYGRLDAVFAQVAREGRLRSQRELRGGLLSPLLWRERGGIEIHLGPDGRPIFGDSGNHRLAMAMVLGIERVPAMLGFVHEAGLPHLARYRGAAAP